MTGISVRFLTFALCLPALGSLCHGEIGLVETGEDQSSVWLRRVVRLAEPNAESSTILHVRGRCHASVYVNGQRLARNVEVAVGRILTFDVTSLIREGANGFAISAHQSAEDQSASVAAWVSHNEAVEALATDNAWKQRLTAPPVGWEKTDFNPHGWQDVQTVSSFSAQDVESETQVNVKWQRPVTPAGHGTPLSLSDGDHVVLLGSTFIERAQLYGDLEAMLFATAGAAEVTFRNLGWSGDTVFAESRGIFDTPEKGFERLVEHIRAEEPTVILICYGQNEAMQTADSSAVERFGKQLRRLHQELQTTGARQLLVSPHPLLFATPPIPSPNRFNPAVEEYALEMQRVAQEQDLEFVDLFSDFPRALAKAQSLVQPDVAFSSDLRPESAAWTDNGMHWNEAGYRRMSIVFAERCLQRDIATPTIQIDAGRRDIQVQHGEMRNVEWSDDGSVQLELRASQLTMLPWEVSVSTDDVAEDLRKVTVSSSSGALSRLIPSVDPGSTLRFVGVTSPQYEQLRTLIARKNELYFHRWRPQNITYLYGFRKHEQGNNAAEIAMFDPLIEELEQQIQALQQPQWETLRVNR